MTAPAPRILLVVNGDAGLSATRQALGREGFDVDAAQTATEAIGLLAGRRYAAIVAAACVPDLPPLDWLAAIRGAAPTTPLVVSTAPASARLDELKHHARDFGVAVVLEPPVSPARLVEAVRAALGHAD